MGKRKTDALPVRSADRPDNDSADPEPVGILNRSDLLSLLDAAFDEYSQQVGEVTVAEEAERRGVTMDRAREILERLVKLGKLVRRRPGNVCFYRLP